MLTFTGWKYYLYSSHIEIGDITNGAISKRINQSWVNFILEILISSNFIDTEGDVDNIGNLLSFTEILKMG